MDSYKADTDIDNFKEKKSKGIILIEDVKSNWNKYSRDSRLSAQVRYGGRHLRK